ncbi:phospholipase D-like domain-containing protein [Sphingomonas sp. H39-1-10]|uniref:phospholipase D-like domain-containing protein n=1 Tax=Sphingomonas pollutisoli TaxID=3030829 RepID=UPI0023B9B390|nr:phospholipase D-like domain-containing protein [Sphingomonas pollutisoli]MDF0486586.1 phospholipase D-like domain-containing protein [Sphingomonas pollutisoli]
MSVLIDADEYFKNARLAMLQAKRRIMLIGWDFDARIHLVGTRGESDEPVAVGDFIYWLVERNPDLEIFLLRWDVGALKTLVRGSNIVTLARWMRHPRIHTKLDGVHPTGGSHHQKIVVIDDCLAFCGGIDMTSERWDTRRHRDVEPRRVVPNGKQYKPWHDATTALQGPVAAALGELARDRWERASGEALTPVDALTDCWPEGLPVGFKDVEVGIARTSPEMPDCPGIREIETLFVEQIASAKVSIYAESQYFASRRIAEAIAARLAEPHGPEIVIVNPQQAEGWLEPVAMDTARARLVVALKRRDAHARLRLYHPFTAKGAPIYVHAKVMIVDGRTLRIGSANMNIRSMGLDTECDVTINAGDEGADAIRAIRDGLIAEHLGLPVERVAAQIDAQGSLIGTIEALRGNGRSLRPYEVPDLSTVEAWLADNEVLDPESPSEMFELTAKRGLFRRLRHPFG